MNIVNDKVTAYIDGLYRPINPAFAELRKQAEAVHTPIVLRDMEGFLLNLVRMKRPAAILEIGTAIGYSAACMAYAFEGCQITTIESNPQMAATAEKNLKNLGVSHRIEILQGQAQEVLERLERGFDFVFIDAAKSRYREFWDKSLPLCNPGAAILCDNVLMQAMTVSDEYDRRNKHRTSIRNMREFLAYITDIRGIDTAVLPIGDGVSLSILKGTL